MLKSGRETQEAKRVATQDRSRDGLVCLRIAAFTCTVPWETANQKAPRRYFAQKKFSLEGEKKKRNVSMHVCGDTRPPALAECSTKHSFTRTIARDVKEDPRKKVEQEKWLIVQQFLGFGYSNIFIIIFWIYIILYTFWIYIILWFYNKSWLYWIFLRFWDSAEAHGCFGENVRKRGRKSLKSLTNDEENRNICGKQEDTHHGKKEYSSRKFIIGNTSRIFGNGIVYLKRHIWADLPVERPISVRKSKPLLGCRPLRMWG